MRKQRFICGILALVVLWLDLCAYYGSSGSLNHWMSNYGHDVLLPMFLYFFNRTIWHRNLNLPLVIAGFVFVGATAVEFAQLGRLYAGTFDPLDIIAYFLGIILALAVDAIAAPSRRRLDEKSRPAYLAASVDATTGVCLRWLRYRRRATEQRRRLPGERGR